MRQTISLNKSLNQNLRNVPHPATGSSGRRNGRHDSESGFVRRAILILIAAVIGCGSNPSQPPAQAPAGQSSSGNPQASSSSETAPTQVEAAKSRKRTIAPVELGGKTTEAPTKSQAEQLEAIRTALKPFQVLLGRWNGLSKKSLSDQPEWAYDWVTNPRQPSLRIVSEKGTYIKEGRLTYLPDSDQFEFSSVDADGARHRFAGNLTEPVRDVIGDEKKPQRTYKLQMTETEPTVDGEQWRITLNQQENNRYILELDRKRGNGQFLRVDTVHTQREGTSFAISDTDYGERTCIISQGLGTISVSYQGQSFWVCCSGCKAAFDEDPVKWIARWEEKKKSMKK